MSDSRKIIQAAKNTLYINYTFDVTGANPNTTTGFTITFPSGAQNIKANNAFISIDKLAYMNYAAGGMSDDIPVVSVQTSIPTTSTLIGFQNETPPKNTGYFENVVWDSFFLDDPNKLARQAYLYTNKNCSRKVLCANPLGNSFNLQFMQFAANGSRAATDFAGGGGADVNTIALTLKVELVEEEIL